jgi:hypothetical protein
VGREVVVESSDAVGPEGRLESWGEGAVVVKRPAGCVADGAVSVDGL